MAANSKTPLLRNFGACVVGAALAITVGCRSADGPKQGSSAASSSASASAPGARKLGAPMTAAPFVRLSSLASAGADYASRRVQTEGLVTAVCQAAGCWMEIRDGRDGAHVKMLGHGFSIPRDAAGHKARVEATVIGTPAQGHCEEEATQAVGKLPDLQLEATGVEIL